MLTYEMCNREGMIEKEREREERGEGERKDVLCSLFKP
jgi:hypothetical protein